MSNPDPHTTGASDSTGSPAHRPRPPGALILAILIMALALAALLPVLKMSYITHASDTEVVGHWMLQQYHQEHIDQVAEWMQKHPQLATVPIDHIITELKKPNSWEMHQGHTDDEGVHETTLVALPSVTIPGDHPATATARVPWRIRITPEDRRRLHWGLLKGQEPQPIGATPLWHIAILKVVEEQHNTR